MARGNKKKMLQVIKRPGSGAALPANMSKKEVEDVRKLARRKGLDEDETVKASAVSTSSFCGAEETSLLATLLA